jgi:hypothetical protein
MKKTITFLILILLVEKHFSQNGFCMSSLADPPFYSITSSAMAKGDFNNDGQADICIQAATYGTMGITRGVSILLSNGTGSYSSFPSYSLTFTSTFYGNVIHLTTGDFNNDGNQDVIAVCDNDSAFFLLKGNGAGGFISKTTFTTSTVPNSLIATDFNNDGKLDIAYSCAASHSVSVMYASTTGFLNPVNYSLGYLPTLLVPGDFNNDNLPDLFALTGNTTYFLKGTANGIFTVTNNLNLNATNVIAEDVNLDNKLDLVYTDITNNKVTILKGNGNFTFASPLSYSVTGVGGSTSLGPVSCADFNSDGKKDLATIYSNYYMLILPGLGNGSFSSPDTYSVNFTSYSYLFNLIVADFNNDHKPDIVALANDNGITPLCAFKLFQNCNTVNVGINEIRKDETDFNLFPNPASDFLQVQFTGNGENLFKTIIIYNELGQVFQQKELIFENGKTMLKTDDLPNGVYLLQLKSESSETINKRFVISR